MQLVILNNPVGLQSVVVAEVFLKKKSYTCIKICLFDCVNESELH